MEKPSAPEHVTLPRSTVQTLVNRLNMVDVATQICGWELQPLKNIRVSLKPWLAIN